MNKSFSITNGYEQAPLINLDNLSTNCKNRLWNRLSKDILSAEENDTLSVGKVIDFILDHIGEEGLPSPSEWQTGKNKIKNYWDKEWYNSLNVLEYFFQYAFGENSSLYQSPSFYLSLFNTIFEEENSGFRVSPEEGKIIKISKGVELKSVSESANTGLDSVDIAIQKAIHHYSSTPPDYENSVKESISAVEAMCNHLTHGKKTLGDALKVLKAMSPSVHPALIKGFTQLYGYTSDEGGIRHSYINFSKVPEEDAKYMLISCSAFINYLKSKWIKEKH